MKRSFSLITAAMLTFGMLTPAGAYAFNESATQESLTSGIQLNIPNTLAFTQPLKDVSTPTEKFFITGSSDPTLPLTINGTEITNRGVSGTFGVYVTLAEGRNKYTASQGGQSVSVIITRDSKASSPFKDPIIVAPAVTKLTNIFPSTVDYATMGGSFILSVTGPSGASITADLAGQRVQMIQKDSTVKAGTAAKFTAKLMPEGQTENVSKLGKITYTMNYKGETTQWTSEGDCYLLNPNSPLVAEVMYSSANVFPKGDTSDWNLVTVLRKGSRDYVIGQNDNMFKLALGGWISKADVTLLEGSQKAVSAVNEIKTGRKDRDEQILFSGTNYPSFSSETTDETFAITFYKTAGIGNVPVKNSSIFTSSSVTSENGNTTITFNKKSSDALWGWNVSYTPDGSTLLVLTSKPSLDANDGLSGITVALDPGHGGSDSGAVGIMKGSGPREKDMTYAQALVLQRKLESMGATVVMCRPEDNNVDLTLRSETAQAAGADIFLSLHINSLDDSIDGWRGKGVEVYTHESMGMPLAKNIAENISSYTNRSNRGAKYSNYKVTMYTYAPSLLCEIGFICNPQEYDSMCSSEGLYNTANAIADGIIATLS